MGRRVGATAAVLVLLGSAAAVFPRSTPPQSARAAVHTPLRLTTVLPAWRAPGARVVVAGFAGSRERLRLLANGRQVAAARSGRLGRFALGFRAGAPGRYRLVVAGAAARQAAGTLVVRPVVLDAVGDVTFGEQVGPAVERYGAAYPWTGVAAELRSADVATANLEEIGRAHV